MKLPGLLYKIGEVDTSKIEEYVNALTNEQWIEWALRQNRYKVHSATESYPFIFSEYGEEPKTYNQDTEIWKVVKPLIDKLEKFYKQFGFRNKQKHSRMWLVNKGQLKDSELPT